MRNIQFLRNCTEVFKLDNEKQDNENSGLFILIFLKQAIYTHTSYWFQSSSSMFPIGIVIIWQTRLSGYLS